MNTLKKFMALIVFVTLSVFPAHAKDKPSLAPVSKEFIEWQKRIREQKDPRYKVNNTSLTVHATGYRPSPVDTSHLSKNLPRRKRQNQGDKFLAKASTIPDPLPVSYDLRTLGRVTPVKDQDPYGTCWVFGPLGACESNYLTQKLVSQNQISYLGDTPDLSELHMAWFVYNDPKPGYNFSFSTEDDSDLNRGGNWYMSTAYMTRLSGPMNESALPYSLAASMDVLSQDPEAYKPVMLELKESRLIGVLSPDMEAKVREDIIDTLFKCVDSLEQMIDNVANGDPEDLIDVSDLVKKLTDILSGKAPAEGDSAPAAAPAKPAAEAPAATTAEPAANELTFDLTETEKTVIKV